MLVMLLFFFSNEVYRIKNRFSYEIARGLNIVQHLLSSFNKLE